jgi:hypothetical protein
LSGAGDSLSGAGGSLSSASHFRLVVGGPWLRAGGSLSGTRDPLLSAGAPSLAACGSLYMGLELTCLVTPQNRREIRAFGQPQSVVLIFGRNFRSAGASGRISSNRRQHKESWCKGTTKSLRWAVVKDLRIPISIALLFRKR